MTSAATDDSARAEPSGPQVRIDAGALSGIDLGKVHTYRGIPYAQPPVGELRYRAPQPVRPWDGIREATEFSPAAPQNRKYTLVGFREYQPTSEDCLTLNVVTPARPATAPRPVMVFIHGGAYLMGSSATPLYYGNSLVTRGDVVFVSINYRLGALGYLDLTDFSTDERPIDGNLGLRDQVAALEWVRRNIAAFGGDPDNVTIFGESAGGNAVTTLLATPAAHGLFHRAIAQSSAPELTVDAAKARGWGKRFVEMLGGPELLATASSEDLGRTGNHLMGELNREQLGVVPYGPTVDGDFLPEDPEAAIAGGRGAQVPLIIGTNRTEATLFTKMPGMGKPSADRVAHTLGVDQGRADQLARAYPGYPGVGALNRIIGDYMFWAPSVRIAQAHARHQPTYFYRYDFAPKTLDLLGYGATHATELMAVFGVYHGITGWVMGALGDRRVAMRVSDGMQRDWITFARTGHPAGEWPTYNGTSRATLVIDDRSRVEYDPAADVRRAWEAFYAS
ncbi:Carboxylic ester hydrolase OS=Tsukamurella paurometabola (strain ATCC 8368 / DSM / CCUG 35730/ CIP 100753 / JCM 10117 / KCTC 9821 / NBRC 16120 / NCIMB 702349 / NCTC 13040) OX=521096 GN=Tpau_0684 PE=3 SV=1 [Tsukamurella paurometabola]|uniref:Carboxylic ester hydrolase n=1 Tax=Tsukamurella paurometabola (strain ATCC 8368 / DSM 20162 / CCUG 35730 / CIP 100753 / JCM 10117 / KCTC 9821 / NBRC 16120 / NCIMB 702349 / NCTC 13040) TaxID=521096 RepID=D5UT34_TSUPD|nr:carboxylesterase/lipase family protein [Tsukamurella paurometabola]ADG77321.1 Carboxylesterase [Tsukamurella paurometabola DSM 20162]SUP43485.1 Para-nitrobenzyl esterase [Tsukamurella paurometabola]